MKVSGASNQSRQMENNAFLLQTGIGFSKWNTMTATYSSAGI